jgi:hypothetical protein
MKFNWLNATTNRQSKQRGKGLEYQRFEPRNLLAGDIGQFGNQGMLIEQLAERADTAWTQKGLNQLVEVGSETDAIGTTTVFQQTWNGLPVFNSWVTVVQDADGEITNVRDHAKQNIEGFARDIEPITESNALKIGSEGLHASEADADASLAWFYTGNRARLSWLVETSVVDDSGNVTDEFETWVNVFDGSVFHREAKGETVTEVLDDPFTETGVFPRIVINDAIGSGGSRLYGANFNSVAFMDVGCTGTLIAPNVVISARHCGDIGAVTFGDNLFSNTVKTYAVESVEFPGGGSASSPLLDGGDVSILTLAEDVPESVATPLRFIDGSSGLEGMVATMVGYGFNGVGSEGHNFSQDFTRWAGDNIIDAVGAPAGSSGSNIISTDFDDGSDAANTIAGSDSTPLLLESTTAPGDSGGPLLLDLDGELVIAGVLSGGTTPTSVYGDISWWTGTTIYRNQIEDAGGEFVSPRSSEGIVSFDKDSYFVGDPIDFSVLDGNVDGDTITVTIGSDSGDNETITISSTFDGRFEASITTSEDAVVDEDGVLQVAAGDEIAILYVDVDDGTGTLINRTDTADILAVPPPEIIGVDFDTADNAPANWVPNLGVGGLLSDLSNEVGLTTSVDLTINGGLNSFAVAIEPTTVPIHSNPLDNVDGQIFTNAAPINFVYSDLNPTSNYDIYVMAAEGFFATIEQTVTIQGDGSPISFEQRFDQFDLFVNDQVGDSTRDLSEYAISVKPNSDGEILIDVDPIAGTSDVVLAGLAILEVPAALVPAPNIEINGAEIERSIVDEVTLSFSDFVTVGADAFELIRRGPGGGVVDVTPVISNGRTGTEVTLTFSGAFATSAGSLVDGNYQLTVFGDEIISSGGVAIDADGDGVAGGNFVFGDTETDNFFRFFGDINGNRLVNVFDLLNFRQAWGSSVGDAEFDAQFDHDGNGNIGVFDLLPFRNNYIDTLDFV